MREWFRSGRFNFPFLLSLAFYLSIFFCLVLPPLSSHLFASIVSIALLSSLFHTYQGRGARTPGPKSSSKVFPTAAFNTPAAPVRSSRAASHRTKPHRRDLSAAPDPCRWLETAPHISVQPRGGHNGLSPSKGNGAWHSYTGRGHDGPYPIHPGRPFLAQWSMVFMVSAPDQSICSCIIETRDAWSSALNRTVHRRSRPQPIVPSTK